MPNMESNESEFTDALSITTDQSSEVIEIVSGEEITPKKGRQKGARESVTYSEEEHKDSEEVEAQKKRKHKKKDIISEEEEEEEEEYDSWSVDEDNENFDWKKFAIFIVALLVLFATAFMLYKNKSKDQTSDLSKHEAEKSIQDGQEAKKLSEVVEIEKVEDEFYVTDTNLESNDKTAEKSKNKTDGKKGKIDMIESNENMRKEADDKNAKENFTLINKKDPAVKTKYLSHADEFEVKKYIHDNPTKEINDIIKNFHDTSISHENITAWFQEIKKEKKFDKPDRPPYLTKKDFPLFPYDILKVREPVTSHYIEIVQVDNGTNDYGTPMTKDVQRWSTYIYKKGAEIRVQQHEDAPEGKLELQMFEGRQDEYLDFENVQFKLELVKRYKPELKDRLKVIKEGIEGPSANQKKDTILNVLEITDVGARVNNENSCEANEFILKKKDYDKVEKHTTKNALEKCFGSYRFPCRLAVFIVTIVVISICIIFAVINAMCPRDL